MAGVSSGSCTQLNTGNSHPFYVILFTLPCGQKIGWGRNRCASHWRFLPRFLQHRSRTEGHARAPLPRLPLQEKKMRERVSDGKRRTKKNRAACRPTQETECECGAPGDVGASTVPSKTSIRVKGSRVKTASFVFAPAGRSVPATRVPVGQNLRM